MKLLIKLLFVTLSSVILFLLIAFFSDRGFIIEETFSTGTTTDNAYAHLSTGYFLFQRNSLIKKDKTIKIWNSGEEGKRGSKLYWASSNQDLGNGSFEIIDLLFSKRISVITSITKPRKFEYYTDLSFSEGKSGSDVTIKISSTKSWPFNLFYLFSNPKEKLESELKETIINIKEEMKKDL